MPGRYSVDLAALDACVARIVALEDFAAKRLAEIDERVDHVQQIWTGEAAAAQRAAHQEWVTGFAIMQTGLKALRAAAAASHRNYSAAVAANASMWP